MFRVVQGSQHGDLRQQISGSQGSHVAGNQLTGEGTRFSLNIV